MSFFDAIHLPAIIAHRGASAFAPENTLAAFRLAAELGADGIELDAKLTADGEIIVIHDPTLERTTTGKGPARRQTLAALRALDAGAWFDPKFAGERLPTLAEVFEEVGQRLFINVELTNYNSPADDLPIRAAALIQRHGMAERVLISSFLPTNLSRIRHLLPLTPVAQLTLPGAAGAMLRGVSARLVNPQAMHPHYRDTTAQLVQQQKKAGRRVLVWTVNDPLEMKRLLDLGVDGLITDDPVLARRVLEG